MSIFFCDSNCELWFDKQEELGIKYISMPYVLDGKEYYYDLGKNTDFRYFYDKIRSGSLPTTSALNEYNYTEYFEPYLKDGQDIIYVTFSHQLSATFEFMNTALEKLKKTYPKRKITIFNTNSISMGAGIQVYYAAKMWKNGASDKEIIEFLEKFTTRIATYFAVDSLHHLKRGGRISALTAIVGSALGIKPLLQIKDDGKIHSVDKLKGKKVISELANLVKDRGEDLDKYDIIVMHADCEKEGKELVTRVKELCGDVNIVLHLVGPVIATHCGAGTLGVIFVSNSR